MPFLIHHNYMMFQLSPEEYEFVMTALEKYAESETARYTDDNKADGRPFKGWWRGQQARAKRVWDLIGKMRKG